MQTKYQILSSDNFFLKKKVIHFIDLKLKIETIRYLKLTRLPFTEIITHIRMEKKM